MFCYFLFPALMRVVPPDNTAELIDEMEINEILLRPELNKPLEAEMNRLKTWSSVARAFRDLLVAVRSVSGFKPADAPDVAVSFVRTNLLSAYLRDIPEWVIYVSYRCQSHFASYIAFPRSIFHSKTYNLLFIRIVQEKFDRSVEIFEAHVDDFIKTMKSLVGDACMTTKMHGLMHVAEDMKRLRQQLYAFSTYPFENGLMRFKTWLKSGNQPLAQIRSLSYNCNRSVCV